MDHGNKTPSSYINKATDFEWYFLDTNKKWTKYGDTDSTDNVNCISNVKSEDIEKEFLNDSNSMFRFNTASFYYELDFSKMIQKNLNTGKERYVRRRPKKKDIKFKEISPTHNKDQSLPSHWDPMRKYDSMIRVLLDSSLKEYVDVEKLFKAEVTNATVISIKRIQNPFLWRPLQNKMNELLLKYSDKQKLNVQKLYHGTKPDIIDIICDQNFDWRLHGTSTGQLYGRGTYFSNSVAYSHGYCPSDSNGYHFMMVAKVIVGYMTNGDASMTRPPTNSSTGMLYDTTVDDVNGPTIFVKYDKQEYYPEYVIKYTTQVHRISSSSPSTSTMLISKRISNKYTTWAQTIPSSSPSTSTMLISKSNSNKNTTRAQSIQPSSPSASTRLISKSYSNKSSYKWSFLDDNGKWIEYRHLIKGQNITSKSIEKYFNKNKNKPLKFKISSYQYELDFTTMLQTNISTGKHRSVKRDTTIQMPSEALYASTTSSAAPYASTTSSVAPYASTTSSAAPYASTTSYAAPYASTTSSAPHVVDKVQIFTWLSIIILLAIAMSMICLGAIKWHECPTQGGMIPIWSVVTGLFLIVLVVQGYITYKYVSPIKTSCWGFLLVLNILFHVVWSFAGCFWVFGAPQVDYDDPTNSNYCDHDFYMSSFWLLNSIWIIMFCITFACMLNMTWDEGGNIMVPLIMLFILLLSMFFTAVFKWNDCNLQHIPIWLIVASVTDIIFLIHLTYDIRNSDDSCLPVFLKILEILFHLAWLITGSVWILGINEPNFDDITKETYCNYTLYKFPFTLLILEWVVIGLILIWNCCCCC